MSEVRQPQGTKLALDLGPLLVFFLANWKFGLLWATAALVVATFVSLVVGFAMTRTINRFALISAAFVGIFGGITLYLQDTFYLKLKVTLVELLFSGVLIGGLYFDRVFVKDMMGSALELPDAAWRTLTIRWALFFAAMALLNLVIWKLFSESAWVTFKAFGLIACTFLFAIANAPFMAKHMKD